MILVLATIYLITRDLTENQFSQHSGEEIGVLVIFSVIFVLSKPFEILEYTTPIITFFSKAQDHSFLVCILVFLIF